MFISWKKDKKVEHKDHGECVLTVKPLPQLRVAEDQDLT